MAEITGLGWLGGSNLPSGPDPDLDLRLTTRMVALGATSAEFCANVACSGYGQLMPAAAVHSEGNPSWTIVSAKRRTSSDITTAWLATKCMLRRPRNGPRLGQSDRPVPTSTDRYRPVLTSTHQYRPVPTSTDQYRPVPRAAVPQAEGRIRGTGAVGWVGRRSARFCRLSSVRCSAASSARTVGARRSASKDT